MEEKGSNTNWEIGHRYVMGVDWGGTQDTTAVATIDATTNKLVAIDRFNADSWNRRKDNLIDIYNQWLPALIISELNSGGVVNIESLQSAGFPVRSLQLTQRSKSSVISRLENAIIFQKITLLDDDKFIEQLNSLEVGETKNGALIYQVANGKTEETLIAVALAWAGVLGALRIDFV